MAYTYTTLVADKSTAGSIANWANRTDLPAAFILEEAQAKIYSRLRAREMIAKAAISLASGSETTAAPSDFISAIQIQWNEDGRPIDKMDVSGFEERCYRDATGSLPEGKPCVFTAIPTDAGGGTYHFDTKADQAYAGFQWYFKRPALLSSSNETNFLTVRYPTLLRRTCMIFAFEHQMDFQRAATVEASVNQMLQEAAVEADTDLAGAIFDSEVR